MNSWCKSCYQSGLLSRNTSVCANGLRAHTAHVPLHSDADISLLNPPSGSVSKHSTAWELAPLVTPLSWRRSPYPHSLPVWSAPPLAIRLSGSNGAMARPKPPPQMPSSISYRWKTRAAGQWLVTRARGSDLTKDKLRKIAYDWRSA